MVFISVEITTYLNLLQIHFTDTVDLTLLMSPASENVEFPIHVRLTIPTIISL